MNIKGWLDSFKSNWADKNVSAILELFSDEVEYWETPHKKLSSIKEVESEWCAIYEQNDIQIETSVFSRSEELDCSTVLWELNYVANGLHYKWAGVYLIKLDSSGRCNYFYQTSELGQ